MTLGPVAPAGSVLSELLASSRPGAIQMFDN
jgi:hypothetical protein